MNPKKRKLESSSSEEANSLSNEHDVVRNPKKRRGTSSSDVPIIQDPIKPIAMVVSPADVDAPSHPIEIPGTEIGEADEEKRSLRADVKRLRDDNSFLFDAWSKLDASFKRDMDWIITEKLRAQKETEIMRVRLKSLKTQLSEQRQKRKGESGGGDRERNEDDQRIRQFEEKVRSLEDQARERDIAEGQEKARYQLQLQELRHENEALEDSLKESRTSAAVNEQEAQRLRHNKELMEAWIARLDAQVTAVAKEKEEVIKKVQSVSLGELTVCQAKVLKLDDENCSLHAKLEHLTKDMDDKTREIAAISEKLRESVCGVDAMQSRKEIAETNLALLQDEFERRETELNEKVRRYEMATSKLQDDLSTTQRELADAKSETNATRLRLQEKEEEVEELYRKENELRESSHAFRDAKADGERETSRLHEIINDVRQHLREGQEHLKEETSRFEREKATLATEIENLRAQIPENEAAVLKDDNRRLRAESSRLGEENQRIWEENKRLRQAATGINL